MPIIDTPTAGATRDAAIRAAYETFEGPRQKAEQALADALHAARSTYIQSTSPGSYGPTYLAAGEALAAAERAADNDFDAAIQAPLAARDAAERAAWAAWHAAPGIAGRPQ